MFGNLETMRLMCQDLVDIFSVFFRKSKNPDV